MKGPGSTRFAFLRHLRRWLRHRQLAMQSHSRIFDRIYHRNRWGDWESASGSGSNLAQTRVVRRVLPLLVEELGCRSLLDIPCGDYFWMKMLDMDIDYTGGDIVPALISS